MADATEQEHVPVTAQDLALSNMLGIEALIRVFIKKGLVTEQEVFDELEAVNRDWAKNQKAPPAS